MLEWSASDLSRAIHARKLAPSEVMAAWLTGANLSLEASSFADNKGGSPRTGQCAASSFSAGPERASCPVGIAVAVKVSVPPNWKSGRLAPLSS